ncbi:MAG: SDR family oxidoreductase [Nocardioides sp.]
MSLAGKRITIVGGGSGIGFRVAQKAIAEGASTIIGSRDEGRLASAVERLGDAATAHTIDTADKDSISRFFGRQETIDHLFISAASYTLGPIDQISDEDAESPFRSKFWGQYWAVRDALPHLAPDGSITLMAGAAGARPVKGIPAYVACNSAIEGLGRALAVDLSPIRVNVVSPGTIDGNLWRQRPEEVRNAAFAGFREISTVGRPGTEDEVADCVLFLMKNGFVTGSTLYPDGGFVLR